MAASSCKSVAPLRQSDFSIEHILTRAGERYSKRRKLSTEPGHGCRTCCTSSPDSDRSDEGDEGDHASGRVRDETGTEADEELEEEIDVGQSAVTQRPEVGFLPSASSGCGVPTFDWLYYTRYHPPKLPRPQKAGPVKRTPGRLPRVPFTPTQLSALEDAYKVSTYLSSEEANQLAYSLELTNTRVKIWFQNRRARDRREKREASLVAGGSFTDSHPHSGLVMPLYGAGSSSSRPGSGSRTGSHPSSPSSLEAIGSRQSRSPTTDRSY